MASVIVPVHFFPWHAWTTRHCKAIIIFWKMSWEWWIGPNGVSAVCLGITATTILIRDQKWGVQPMLLAPRLHIPCSNNWNWILQKNRPLPLLQLPLQVLPLRILFPMLRPTILSILHNHNWVPNGVIFGIKPNYGAFIYCSCPRECNDEKTIRPMFTRVNTKRTRMRVSCIGTWMFGYTHLLPLLVWILPAQVQVQVATIRNLQRPYQQFNPSNCQSMPFFGRNCSSVSIPFLLLVAWQATIIRIFLFQTRRKFIGCWKSEHQCHNPRRLLLPVTIMVVLSVTSKLHHRHPHLHPRRRKRHHQIYYYQYRKIHHHYNFMLLRQVIPYNPFSREWSSLNIPR